MLESFSEFINLLSVSIREAKIIFSILSEYRADMTYPKGKNLPFIKKRKSNTHIRDAVSYNQLQ